MILIALALFLRVLYTTYWCLTAERLRENRLDIELTLLRENYF